MTPLKNTGIDTHSLHDYIHLFLIIKNTLLTGPNCARVVRFSEEHLCALGIINFQLTRNIIRGQRRHWSRNHSRLLGSILNEAFNKKWHASRVIDMRDEIIMEQKVEISKLKHALNNARAKLKSKELWRIKKPQLRGLSYSS